jgi:hypothetical protein
MARIELRNANVRLVDGHSNTAAVDDTLSADDTNMDIDTLGTSALIPVGCRFTVVGAPETFRVTAQNGNAVFTFDLNSASSGSGTLTIAGLAATVAVAHDDDASDVLTSINADSNVTAGDFTVTGAGTGGDPFVISATSSGAFADTDLSITFVQGTLDAAPNTDETHAGGETHNITFTPAISTGNVPSDDAVITFTGRALDVKVGEGNMTYTENREYNYDLDRGNLDTVREGDQIPIDWTLDFTWEFLSSIAGATTPTIEEVFKREGAAADWVSSSDDQCEPYAIDIEVEHVPACGNEQVERITIPDARYESLDHNIEDATVSASGRSNATRVIKTRYAAA